jgi:hypothetical protein
VWSDVAVFASLAAGVGGRTVADAALGYAESPVVTRSVWASSSSFAGTVLLSRVGNHLRENGRRSPISRAAGRLVIRGFSSNEMRIHHYLPGHRGGLRSWQPGAADPSRLSISVAGVGVRRRRPAHRRRAQSARQPQRPVLRRTTFRVAASGPAGCVSIGVALRFLRTGRARRERGVLSLRRLAVGASLAMRTATVPLPPG